MYFPKLQTPRKRHAFGVFLFVIAKLQLFFRLFRKGDHLAVGLLAQVVLDLAGVLGGRLRVNAQREGIAIAKAQGKFKGRKEVKADDFAAQYQRYLNRELNKAQLAKTLEISLRKKKAYSHQKDKNQLYSDKNSDDTYQVQVVSWYDNENSYTSQMVRTIKYFAEL